jgi:hypothetical protein
MRGSFATDDERLLIEQAELRPELVGMLQVVAEDLLEFTQPATHLFD